MIDYHIPWSSKLRADPDFFASSRQSWKASLALVTP